MMNKSKKPQKQGLYDPAYEHDACGVGFVVNIKGIKSNAIIKNALEVLDNLEHRGACGCEVNTGDGAGILLQIPHAFFTKVCKIENIELPASGDYGVGMVFLPTDERERNICTRTIESIIVQEEQNVLGWRKVPTNDKDLGKTAQEGEPIIQQIFIGKNRVTTDEMAFERKLFVIRKRIENALKNRTHGKNYELVYLPSLSCRTIVYKGMLISHQMTRFYPDLLDTDMESALALVHSRFSTNTFPSWDRAHPYRFIIHNGEINTLRGNINWMHARQAVFTSDVLGNDLKKILPVIDAEGSDSAMFDNCLEFLYFSGWSLPHAIMMMIPEPWQKHTTMSDERKAFYEYHSSLMEPWDGPASIAFTDGKVVGAILDRNGLRPSRYYVTKDDMVIMGSEVGVLNVPAERVKYKGRLEPGRIFLIDTQEGRIISNEELKKRMEQEHPYQAWLAKYRLKLEDLPAAVQIEEPDHDTLLQRQLAFGYTFEELRMLLAPMAQNGIEALGSMGNDTPLAVLSEKPKVLYNYFKQLFAQVTNPPIDSIREEIVTATELLLGSEGNLLKLRPENCHGIRIQSPILTNEETAKLKSIQRDGFKSVTLPMLFEIDNDPTALEKALENLYNKADDAISDGANIIILSDREIDKSNAPIPALLATAGLHHHLIRNGRRTVVSLILETGETREVHHFSVIIGYGASAVNPYLALESLDGMIKDKMLKKIDHATAIKNYVKAATKGVVKVLSKMGISTIQSYRGAQIFEAVGLNKELIDKYFTWTASRIGGIGLEEIYQELISYHNRAFNERQADGHTLDAGGDYQWRRNGEKHLFNPKTVHLLQKACRLNDYAKFMEYSELINVQEAELYTLRGLFGLNYGENSIPLEEVESVEAICKRFKTGAMSYGSISKEAHEGLAIAMNRIGGKSNTGEGGEDPTRYILDANGDSRNSAIKQVASGRFGVTSEYLVQARELQIKMAQGAKPGEGGQLPGRKVYPWIAKVRLSTPGVGLISPPPHHDIYSIEDLAELIHDLKNSNPDARISVKLVSEVGVGTVAAGVAKGHADVVLISGHDGGTGASPQTSIKHAGLPWELGLAETHQTLVLNNLRSRIIVETDGQLKTGRDVVIATLLGAEEYGFATAPLVVMGCIMMRVCHLDTCPVGVATQNPELRKKFAGSPDHVVNFMRFIAQEVREIMAKLGFRTINEMVGRTDKINIKKAARHWKAKRLDLAPILFQPDVPDDVGRYCQIPQEHGLEKSLDRTTLLEICRPAIENGTKVEASLPIRNINRVVGTIVGYELTKHQGPKGLPDDTIKIHFKGSAGQSFGAFIPKGMTFTLEGDANDYFGKGVSGGKFTVFPPEQSTFVPEENIIIGNVAFYGATSGEAYIYGMAGERFCVRNSGVRVVVEAVGDHGCEYMTGGCVVVLGSTGRNFGAGMSGGAAYVFDEAGDFAHRFNHQMASLEAPADEDLEVLESMIRKHAELTKSKKAWKILAMWEDESKKFCKVMPHDFKRMQQAMKNAERAGLNGDEAIMTAFKENVSDASRVTGN